MRSRILRVGALLLLAACGPKTPPLARLEAEALFERGMTHLQAGKWTDAITALEYFVSAFPTHPRMQEARYRTAEAYFGKKEYVTAATEFVRLATDYPTGQYSDDSRFRACEAYVRLSPDTQRDQEYTRAAIEHCDALVASFPSSEFAPRAQATVVEMRDKLAEKLFHGGEHYFKHRAYDSAIIYYEDVLREYPRSPAAPRALLRLVQTYRTIGYAEEAEAAKERLLREYPDSAEAQQVKETSIAEKR